MTDQPAQATAKAYKGWKKVNERPVLSASHGNRFVFTYLNPQAAPAGLGGKFPFPEGSVLAKESFENEAGQPGARSALTSWRSGGKATIPPTTTGITRWSTPMERWA